MAWIGQMLLDDGKSDAGTATCIWNQGLADQFTYSQRVQLTAAGKNALIAAAKSALATRQSKAAAEATFSANLTAALNA